MPAPTPPRGQPADPNTWLTPTWPALKARSVSWLLRHTWLGTSQQVAVTGRGVCLVPAHSLPTDSGPPLVPNECSKGPGAFSSQHQIPSPQLSGSRSPTAPIFQLPIFLPELSTLPAQPPAPGSYFTTLLVPPLPLGSLPSAPFQFFIAPVPIPLSPHSPSSFSHLPAPPPQTPDVWLVVLYLEQSPSPGHSWREKALSLPTV